MSCGIINDMYILNQELMQDIYENKMIPRLRIV